MHYVYVLRNNKKQFYYGQTVDLKRRFDQHAGGKVKSTRGRTWKLIYYEAYADKRDAILREQRLKQAGQAIAQLKRRIAYSIQS